MTYSLSQSFSEGEFSVLATGLNSDSAGDSTKLFSMQQGTSDLTTNPYRATIEKRDNGTVTFRFIAGDVNARRTANVSTCSSTRLPFTSGNSPGGTVLHGSWSSKAARMAASIYNQGDSYSGTYRPSPYIAYLGAPPGRIGIRQRFGTGCRNQQRLAVEQTASFRTRQRNRHEMSLSVAVVRQRALQRIRAACEARASQTNRRSTPSRRARHDATAGAATPAEAGACSDTAGAAPRS